MKSIAIIYKYSYLATSSPLSLLPTPPPSAPSSVTEQQNVPYIVKILGNGPSDGSVISVPGLLMVLD